MKRDVVATIEKLAALIGQEVHDPDGSARFGGHLLRVTGAQYLASIGIEILKIQILARWESEVVLRYVREAPLATIATDVKKARLDKADLPPAHLALEDIKEDVKGRVLAEMEATAKESEPTRDKSRRVSILDSGPTTHTVGALETHLVLVFDTFNGCFLDCQ